MEDISSYSQRQQRLWQTHIRAWTSYSPQPYGGRVVLFRSPVHQLYGSFDRANGWRELVRGGVDVHIIQSGHDTILEEPQVQELGASLRQALLRAHAGRV